MWLSPPSTPHPPKKGEESWAYDVRFWKVSPSPLLGCYQPELRHVHTLRSDLGISAILIEMWEQLREKKKYMEHIKQKSVMW